MQPAAAAAAAYATSILDYIPHLAGQNTHEGMQDLVLTTGLSQSLPAAFCYQQVLEGLKLKGSKHWEKIEVLTLAWAQILHSLGLGLCRPC